MSGPLPSVSAMKKTLLTVAAAVAWFLPGHLVILALLVLVWGSAMATTTNTAKARGTEARLAAHITATAPAVNFVANGGSVGGSVTVNGNHTVTGALGVHGGGTVIGQWASDALVVNNGANIGNLAVSGAASTGANHTVFGALGVHSGSSLLGGIGVSGGANIDNLAVSGAASTGGNHTVFGALGVHSGGTVVGGQWAMSANAVINGGNVMPVGGPGTISGTGTTSQLTNAVNAIITTLRGANVWS